MHTTQTAGPTLATDLAPMESQPRVVGLLHVMLLLGSIVSALVFGAMLEDFSPGRLVQVIQAAAVATIALNLAALRKQKTHRLGRGAVAPQPVLTLRRSWGSFAAGEQALHRLLALGLGTVAFSMQNVLLEPCGGQVLQLTVSATTTLTATPALGGLLGFWLTSRMLAKGADPFRIAAWGALVGVALGGVPHDGVTGLAAHQGPSTGGHGSATGYIVVYGIEVLLLCTLLAAGPLKRQHGRSAAVASAAAD